MKRLRWLLPLLVAAVALQPAQAQQVRAVQTQVIRPAAAPVQIDPYEATYQTLEDGFYTLAFLKEMVTLQNATQDRVAAVEVEIIYLDAFGGQIDVVTETFIREIRARSSVTETIRSQLPYTAPIYSAIAYPRQVRLEPAGRPDRAMIWRADSTEVVSQVRRLLGGITLAQEQE